MKEEQETRELIQESLLHTSSDFTDTLMTALEHKKKPAEIPGKLKLGVLASTLILLVVPLIWQLSTAIYKAPSILVFTPVILFVFVLINKFLTLTETQQPVRENR